MEKRIIIVNVNWIGDVLFSTPFIRAVREAYPDSHIACLLHPRCAEMLEGNPRLNEIIIYDEEDAHRSLLGKLALIADLRRRRFDAAFILHRSFTKALLVTLAGVKERIGYPTKHRSLLLTRTVETPDEEIHKVEYFLNIAKQSGIRTGDPSYEFFITDADRNFAKDFLLANGVRDKEILVAICPGGNWNPKRWPKENFASLCDRLIEKFRAKIVITGARKDAGLTMQIEKMIKGKSINASGRTSLKQLGAIFERANLVVANDTGSMHLAVAMKAKVIALFGPTSPDLTGPYGSGSYKVIANSQGCEVPCYDVSCSKNRCMEAISVEEVLKASADMIDQKL